MNSQTISSDNNSHHISNGGHSVLHRDYGSASKLPFTHDYRASITTLNSGHILT